MLLLETQQVKHNYNDINAAYVDGVSLTHGTPHNHIWTFAAAIHE